jgi:prephenate dehydratase
MGGIAYLGPEGTFSGILARQRFGAKAPLVPCPAIDGVFEAVLSGKAEFGIVPVENSSGGTVHDTIDLLIRHAGGVSILEETSLDIRIALLGHRGQPIRRIFSHFTQLRHHADWLLKNHPEARHTAVESTTTAAAQAAKKKDAAALASPGAAKIYGLDILRPRIGREVNVTHFFVIGKKPTDPALAGRAAFAAVLPNRCGSLHAFLGPFAKHQVSLTRIISRPVPGKPQTYVFYVEIEGSPLAPRTARALAAARRQSESLALLGAFRLGRRFRS